MDEFIRLLRTLQRRTEIKEIFAKYSGGNRTMTPNQLLNFLQVEQRDTHITIENVMNIIMQFSQNVSLPFFLVIYPHVLSYVCILN